MEGASGPGAPSDEETGRSERALSRVYLALAAAGAILPLSALLPWLAAHGLDPALFVSELFSTRIGSFFGWDVIVSALALILFIRVEGRRRAIRHRWLPIAATLTVGVSCGLPLFLALRARSVPRGGDERRSPRLFR